MADSVGIEFDRLRGDRNRGALAAGFEDDVDAGLLIDNQGDASDLLLGKAGSIGKDTVQAWD